MAKKLNIYQFSVGVINALADTVSISVVKDIAVNPPFVSLFIYPCILMKYNIAASLWFLLNSVLFLLSIYILSCIVRKKYVVDAVTVTVLFIVLNFQPLIEGLWLGNYYFIILFCFVAGLHLINKNNLYLAGVFIAIPFMLKPQFGLILLFLLWKKKFSLFNWTILYIFLLSLSTLFVYGIDIHVSYLKVLKPILLGNSFLFSASNLSLNGFLSRLIDPGGSESALGLFNVLKIVLPLVFLIITAYVTKPIKQEPDIFFMFDFALIIVLIMIISPIVHEAHYVLLYIPIFIYAYYIFGYLLEDKCILCLFIISYLLTGLCYSLIQYPIFHKGLLSLFSNGKFFGVILLFLLGIKILNHLKRSEKVREIILK
jgi:hypothetical protein